MIRPDDKDKPFIARWNSLMRVLLVDTKTKMVGRSVIDFANWQDGSKCRPSCERIARETGLSERTVRTGLGVLRGLGFLERVGFAVAHLHEPDQHQLVIPANWYTKPVLGPNGRKFRCLQCRKLFNPRGNCALKTDKSKPRGDGVVSFDLAEFCFCPAPREKNGRPGEWCFRAWNRDRKEAGLPLMSGLGPEAWELVREARGDDW